ncbi:MAG: hypothetical protein EZS28_011530 [Streblomastix strix]|uniref:HNH nuclease domain-containing protein n=1 Tax=Streblomastix strix TaxID=222440 RepID=A0A5J4WDH9_9EUKA|nr:MAG: hypothetical protein EZS28_011530 [Streblomastix strix]
MTYLVKETIEERIARVISQKQDYEEITVFPRYRINEKSLEVWDTRLDREVKPHSKKNRAGAYNGMQIQLIDENNERHELAFDKIVSEQFVSNKNTKINHLDNDLENCTVDNLVQVDDFHYTLYNPAKYGRIIAQDKMKNKITDILSYKNHPLDNYYIDEAYNIWYFNEENYTYMELIEQGKYVIAYDTNKVQFEMYVETVLKQL